VRVVRAIDQDVYDVSGLIGREGIVEQIVTDAKTGEVMDPRYCVRFGKRKTECFWRTELKVLRG